MSLQACNYIDEETCKIIKNKRMCRNTREILEANMDDNNFKYSVQKQSTICSVPVSVPICPNYNVPTVRELTHNPKYEELFAPLTGPNNPFLSAQMKTEKNMLSGYMEFEHINEFQFEHQRRTFNTFGYALDPSSNNSTIGNCKSAFETTQLRPLDKRKRWKNNNPAEIADFQGPWGGYIDEQRVMKPSEEEAAILQEFLAKRRKRSEQVEEGHIEEKSVLHVKDAFDYQGRPFLNSRDTSVKLTSHVEPKHCFLPKSHIHTWTGHTKGITAISWFPRSAHLLLSAGMDCKIKIWEVYNERRCIRTYYGHRQAVKDINFNNSGKNFLSAAYDRYIKLWDTESGQVISKFRSRKIPYCVKFNPDEHRQHMFVAGTSDKKIICWDTRAGDIVQEYDRHLGAINTITFIDENRRFVSTSDDESIRVWDWAVPVETKYVSEPTMHSMPAVTLSPNGKWLACQSMDNKIAIFSALDPFRVNRKKVFSGHMVAGYACTLDFSPDMRYIISGDADGICSVWDWKTTKLYKRWKAHDDVCINVLWHPHEASRLVTAGWDGAIKYWD